MMSDSLKEIDRKRVSAFIEQEVGIQLPQSKHSLVETRLRKRQRVLGMGSLGDYIDFVLSNNEGLDERLHMVDALTTNKTDFYRESYHFEFLTEILGSLQKQKQWSYQKPFKLWSAGCSTGEEPYTLAIELTELQRQLAKFDFNLMATDISISCLHTAKRGIYSHARIEPVDLALRKRYLLSSKDPKESRVQITPEIKNKIDFSFFNLLSSNYADYTGAFDVIFCRNVMIYFNNHDRDLIIENFARCLKKDGILFIGHSESLHDSSSLFKRIKPTIYQLN
jgi:chemotaxis protein methyltransferase CheR